MSVQRRLFWGAFILLSPSLGTSLNYVLGFIEPFVLLKPFLVKLFSHLPQDENRAGLALLANLNTREQCPLSRKHRKVIGWYRTENSFILLVFPVLSTMHDIGLSMSESITNHVMVGIYCAYSIPSSFLMSFLSLPPSPPPIWVLLKWSEHGKTIFLEYSFSFFGFSFDTGSCI